MSFDMPPTFPQSAFKEFGKLANKLFPCSLSDENFNDPFQRFLNFQNAWQAVCYRYRARSEQNAAFKTIFNKAIADSLWREWSEGEEYHCALEQCLYSFFMNALSVFESLGFCLYFVGAMIDHKNFPNVSNPRNITLRTTRTAFDLGFPHTSLTIHLTELLKDPDFIRIDTIRNLLAHRLCGGEISAFALLIPMGHTPRQKKSFGIFQV